MDFPKGAKGYIDEAMYYPSHRATDFYNRYKEDISLQSVAEEMNYSDAYFCKIFKQCFDKSFIGYLTEYRLERAKQLLADVRINVKDISVNVGYRDSNYFAKVFKRAMGSTPTEYRMEILKQMNKGNTAGGLG